MILREGVFQSIDPAPRPVSLPASLLNRLTGSLRPQSVSASHAPIPWALFYPVAVEGECVACWALSPPKKFPRSSLPSEAKNLVEMAVDRTAGCLGERALWNGLENANRQNTLGWMSAAILHEMRNPLTSLGTFVQLFPQKRGDTAFVDSFEKLAQKEIQRLIGLTGDILHFLKADPERQEKVELGPLLDQVGELVQPLFHSRGVKLRVKTSKTPPIRGNGAQIESLMLNLLQNALEAVKTGGKVEVSSRALPASGRGKGRVQLQVKDNGLGIPQKDFHRIFRPFFTSKNAGNGLGLAICQKVVENHEGKMEVKSVLGKGTVFSVSLPLSGHS